MAEQSTDVYIGDCIERRIEAARIVHHLNKIVDVNDMRLAHLNKMLVDLQNHATIDGTLQWNAMRTPSHDDFPYPPLTVVYKHADILNIHKPEVGRIGIQQQFLIDKVSLDIGHF